MRRYSNVLKGILCTEREKNPYTYTYYTYVYILLPTNKSENSYINLIIAWNCVWCVCIYTRASVCAVCGINYNSGNGICRYIYYYTRMCVQCDGIMSSASLLFLKLWNDHTIIHVYYIETSFIQCMIIKRPMISNSLYRITNNTI